MQKQLAILRENDANTKDEQVKMLNQIKVAADNQATVATERMMKQKDEIFKFLSDVSVAGRNITLPPSSLLRTLPTSIWGARPHMIWVSLCVRIWLRLTLTQRRNKTIS